LKVDSWLLVIGFIELDDWQSPPSEDYTPKELRLVTS